ncbi:TonB-dependent receptor [Glacieibacterium megasporae]|uniref:TonB-dependent receptor n=1 Tax=Glacieibacterium megasporae TaxID=2835787 RepID=UPI001C1E14C8|nr:TonB-dependent receptor [Polymorphobacter megasporae]UAJ09102.1 TonB-dependent receptor [Polymorphobacter megasporae]
MRVLFGLLATAAIICPIAVSAQDAPAAVRAADAPTMIADATVPEGDIIVTAERRSGSLQKTPISVSAFPTTALKDLQINRTADLQRFVPSLSVAQGTVDPTTLTIFMRGAGQNAGTWVGYESAVGLYVDDLYFSRLTGANVDLADLERIEVLRGPQGTLYGRNTLVGAIKYITKKPSATPFGSFDAEAGEYDMVRLKGTISTPLSDNWAALVGGNYYRRDGFSNAPALNDRHYGDREEYGGRAAFNYIGTGPFELYASGFYTHARNDGSIGLATSPVTLQPATSNPYDYLSPIKGYGGSTTYGGSVTLGYALTDNAKIKSITGVIGGSQDILADTTAGRPNNGPGNYLLGFDRLTSHSSQTQISEELQIVGDAFGGKLDYIGGLYYFHEKGEQSRQDLLLSIYNTLPQLVHMTTDSYAAFGQLTYKLTDQLSIVGGVRYTDETKSVLGQTQAGLTATTYAQINAKRPAKAWTPKLGVNYQITPTILAYASASRGFQAGGFNYLAVVNAASYQTGFDPQTVWAYEAGLKTQFLDRKGRFNLALFRNDFSNIQTNVVVAGSSLTQNAGTARVQGVEGEFSLTPVEGLTLFANASYNDDKYLSLNPASAAATSRARYIPNVPHLQAAAGFTGAIPIKRGKIELGADYSFMDSKYLAANDAPITLMPSYSLVNAYIGIAPANTRLNLRLSLANLLDQRYLVYGNVLGAYGIRSPGDPRTFKVSINYQY